MRQGFCLAAVLLVGCLPEEAADGDGVGPPAPDAAAMQEGDAALADAAVPDMAPEPQPCTWPADCPMGDCIDGVCRNEIPQRCPDGDESLCDEGEVCGGFEEGYYCFTDCELDGSCWVRTRPCAAHVNCPGRMSCHDSFCINNCVTDVDCPENGYCLEGECTPYPDDLFTGDPPLPLGMPGQLYAGVGSARLDFPVGVSMAGYGGRPGPRTPYNVSLGGSDRVFEGQDVRVVVLTTDADILILVRLPLSWSTDYMSTLIALKLQALTGVNYHGKIITAATHSHSQPARYWNMVPGVGFGIFGYGRFSNEMVHRYTQSFAEGIADALDNLQPARFGWHLIDGFDPQHRVHSDRRGESPEFLDDRMLLWRVDDTDGNPIAGVVNFAMHGTHMEYPWVTADAPGGIEVVATERMSAAYNRNVPFLFINGNAGNASPRGDDASNVDWAKMQRVGHLAWNTIKTAFDDIETVADVHLEVVTRHVPIDYARLGYEDGEFRWNDESVQEYGAFQCVSDSRGPNESYTDGELGCAINIQQFFGAPIPQMGKTLLTAARLDDLVITTLPGEPTSELGVELSELIEADADAEGHDIRVMQFGYSQDHHLYLLKQEDWFYGGYEAAQNLWGWRLGQLIIDESRMLAFQLFTDEKEDNTTGVKPTWWPNLEDVTVTPLPTAGTSGEMLVQPPAAMTRGALFEAVWTGGHPGVDRPYVSLELEGEDGFETALRPGGRPFDEEGFETLTIYRGDYQGDDTWAARWELPFDLPLGTYRLRMVGESLSGPYDTTTEQFLLERATLQVHAVAVEGDTATISLGYPNGPSNDTGDNTFEALEMHGHWLRWGEEVDSPGNGRDWSFVLGGPLSPGAPLRVTIDGGGAAEVAIEIAGQDVQLVTSRTADGEEGTTQISGWPTTRVAVAGLASGERALTLEDAFGNRVELQVVIP